MKTTIYLVRSAECEGNLNNILGEKNNFELTEYGKDSIKRLEKYFEDKNIWKIYSSNSQMCVQTVETISEKLNLKIEINENLKEKSFGEYDGKCWEEVLSLDPSLAKYRKKKIEILGIKGQESTKMVEDRMYDTIANIARESLGQNILIVSHGVAIETFIRKIVGIPYSEDKDKYFQKNSAINKIVYDEDLDLFEVIEVSKVLK